MCTKSWSDMIVPTFLSGTILETRCLNAQLPHSSGMKVNVQTIQIAVILMPAHIPSSPIRRIDYHSSATTVLPTSQQGQTIMAADRAKMGVRESQGTAFYAINLAIGHRSVHSMAGCNCYLHIYLSRTNRSKKA